MDRHNSCNRGSSSSNYNSSISYTSANFDIFRNTFMMMMMMMIYALLTVDE